jgi:hypothetical protein
MALGAAAVFAVYLTIGGELRAWMPLFLYAVPVRKTLAQPLAHLRSRTRMLTDARCCAAALQVNGTAAAVLTAVGVLFEGARPWGGGARGVFGFVNKGRCVTPLTWHHTALRAHARKTHALTRAWRCMYAVLRYAATTMYLSLVPGIVGHTSFNAVLKYISPMVVTLGARTRASAAPPCVRLRGRSADAIPRALAALRAACTAEPLIGSVIGWLAGVSRPPGARTYVGGFVLIAATMAVVRAEELRKAAAPPVAAAPAPAEGSDAAACADAAAAARALELQPVQRPGGDGDARADASGA